MSLAPNESATDLWNERSNFAGTILETTGYGCHLVLFIMCASALINRPSGGKIAWWSLGYITTMFIVNTIANAFNIKFNEMMFIDDRAGPGGPLGFLETQFSNPMEVGSIGASFVNSWLQDGLLLYRFFIVFGSNRYLVIAPGIIYLASIAMACILLFQLSQPLANIWQTTSVNFAIPFWSISIALNIILTTSICMRLLIQRRRARASLGESHGATYVSIAAMIVESAALYTVVALVFLITFARNSYVQNLALGLLAPAQCIAPLLIIYRVAEGRAWTKDTAKTMSAMRYSRNTGSSATRVTQNSAMRYSQHSGAYPLGQLRSLNDSHVKTSLSAEYEPKGRANSEDV